ncbi:NAD(P)/FAD-dependent oxidoreductase [Rhodococcus sp. ABRD24]|uniref:phytoene desaturase family protein n=1 Tax=Rhodococcus sp. ABRD24 TaxID=2507582 RepID=UPI0013F14780|nr:NAD(P)/FAD-dependent oxidoreductase [Rhodococcus sp. ABRD24]
MTTYDAVVIGAGHNGLVSASYLANNGYSVLVLESRSVPGGATGDFEFLPGYRGAFTNSPGSFDPLVLRELELERYGLRFFRPELAVVHRFEDQTFIGWRDKTKLAAEIDQFRRGESDRYATLIADLDYLGKSLPVSLYHVPDPLEVIERKLETDRARALFKKVFHGSLRELMDEYLETPQMKAVLMMLALNGNRISPEEPGSAVGLLLRPLSMSAHTQLDAAFQASPLRGSAGLPVGGMNSIVRALVNLISAHPGSAVRTDSPVTGVQRNSRTGALDVVLADGTTVATRRVLSAIDPRQTVCEIFGSFEELESARNDFADKEIHGSAFKIALALDALPEYAGLPEGVTSADASTCQFRVAHSDQAISAALAEALTDQPSTNPIMWGLNLSVASPGYHSPTGKYLLSVNAWHAPYSLADGTWNRETVDAFGRRCLDDIRGLLPDIDSKIVDTRFMGPVEIEATLGLPKSNITYGDMSVAGLFEGRPLPSLQGARTPVAGLYLCGSGVWPGGYVTGIPGRNAAQALMADSPPGGVAERGSLT